MSRNCNLRIVSSAFLEIGRTLPRWQSPGTETLGLLRIEMLQILNDGGPLASIVQTKRHVVIRNDTVRFGSPFVESLLIPGDMRSFRRI